MKYPSGGSYLKLILELFETAYMEFKDHKKYNFYDLLALVQREAFLMIRVLSEQN